MILDIIEVAESHSGANLAAAIMKILEDLQISEKILSMTCDNALANHKMVDKLHIMLLEFGRWASHTQCFLHTMNLVTKALLSQFDVRKGSAVDAALSEVEEHETGAKALNANVDSEVDDTEGLVDLMDEMDPAEWAVHEEHLCPVRLVLMKICKLAFKIINSMTILLLEWHQMLERLKLWCHNMLRNIQTHCNLTYDMLVFALEYCSAVESLTQIRDLGLRRYELGPEEWALAQQLANMLKVC
ncbi:hypothetical protein AX14_001188 [Amanita brunnescens Koide BX004]|nr:hypothetical protein AX14_001188 [Amanita brunnescens Koide BX004]